MITVVLPLVVSCTCNTQTARLLVQRYLLPPHHQLQFTKSRQCFHRTLGSNGGVRDTIFKGKLDRVTGTTRNASAPTNRERCNQICIWSQPLRTARHTMRCRVHCPQGKPIKPYWNIQGARIYSVPAVAANVGWLVISLRTRPTATMEARLISGPIIFTNTSTILDAPMVPLMLMWDKRDW